MPNIKLIKNPGFLYDLNFLFYAKFNTKLCVESLADESKRKAYEKYLKETVQRFGDIPDDLYVFYHAAKNEKCLITTYYMDPYKEQFLTDFDFKYFKNLLFDIEALKKNIIRFYLNELSEDALEECFASTAKLFAYIKRSNHSSEEKSKLYEFFIDPLPYFQLLQNELSEKEALLAAYYKDHFETILEAHNNTTFETLCEPIKGTKDLSFLNSDDQLLYTSFCLINKYLMKLAFISAGAIYLLGYDYVSIINAVVNSSKPIPLENLCNALSETCRIQILNLLVEQEEITCKDLERAFDFSGSTAYHHLTLLTKVGAVKVRNEGKVIYYSLNHRLFDLMIAQLKIYAKC